MISRRESPPPRIRRLRVFNAIAAQGSMSAAAEHLGLTQPAVTRATRALETELGVILLERRRGGSFLTAEGDILARRTHRFFVQLAGAVGEAMGEDPTSPAVIQVIRKMGDPHIRNLIAIWRGGNFKQAASLLGFDEPTIFRPARDMERWMRMTLYQHTVGGLSLTPTAQELSRQFALAMVEIASAVDELAEHLESSGMTLYVAVLPLAPKRRLARATEELLRRRPRLRVVIEEGLYPDLLGSLRSGTIDLIFGALGSLPPFDDLHEEVLFTDSYAIACRRGHPLVGSPVSSSSMKEYDWVFPAHWLRRRTVLDELIVTWDLASHAQIETNSMDATVAALVMSDRLSLLPQVCIDENVEAISALDIAVPQPFRTVGITRRLGWLPTAAQTELIDLLRDPARA